MSSLIQTLQPHLLTHDSLEWKRQTDRHPSENDGSGEADFYVYEVTGLVVANLEGNKLILFPKVYTQRTIPVTNNNKLTPNDLRGQSYMKDINLTEIDNYVELLIGVNVPKAMEPPQVINSQHDGPYPWTVP